MPAPTSLAVSLDAAEYSRYESAHKTIYVTVAAAGGGTYTSEQIRVELVKARRDRDAVVYSVLLTANGAAPQSLSAEIDLSTIVDADTINLVRFGKYFVRATSVTDTSVVGESPDVDVRVITVEKFKEDYLFGIRLFSTEIKHVKYQPANITGLQITEVSKNSQLGFGTLSYTYAAGPVRTLSWNNGTAVTVGAAGTYLLKGGGTGPLAALGLTSDYIVVKINSLAALPVASQTDSIFVEEKQISDSTVASYIDKAVTAVEEELLWVRVEPTKVVTDPVEDFSPTEVDYDFLVSPLTYFPRPNASWVSINTPYLQLLRVDNLFGCIATQKILELDLRWISINMNGGLIQLVPVTSLTKFSSLGLLWNNSLRGGKEIPNFWRFIMTVGLRECTADIRDLICKKAAIDLLAMLGAAFKPGIGSVSLSRDGVSQSTSMAQGKYGPYSGLITSLKESFDKDLVRLRARYRGAAVAVV